MLGEMTWLRTRSPLHKAFAIGDLGWLVMPALIHQQFYVFREGSQPVGLALWARCAPAAAAKLHAGMVEPENRLTLEEWNGGDEVWLVDLIAPFANAENRHREVMLADLISKPLAGQEFRYRRTDAKSGRREVHVVPADGGRGLRKPWQGPSGSARRILACLERATAYSQPASPF